MQKIDKIEVCLPIETLVNFLESKGFEIIEKKVNDFHFHEVYIKLKGENSNNLENVDIKDISKVDSSTFSCSCHWSIVELSYI